jgi:hypothetical protein
MPVTDRQSKADLTRDMFNALRYYWIIAKGYRLQPWKSPYIQWRMETFFGPDAADLDRRNFFRLMWRERARVRHFLHWVAQRKATQSVRGENQ